MKQNTSSKFLSIGVALSLVIAVACGGIYFLVFKGPVDATTSVANNGYDLLKRAGKDLYHALQFEPKVTIGGETVYGPAKQITEIATASREFNHTYIYEVEWLFSTKKLKLKGDFRAKAGFTVDESFVMEISEDGSKVTLHHEEPILLSCEMTKYYVLEDKGGIWNKITNQERQSAVNELTRRARKRALDDDLISTATENLLERLKPLQQEYSFTTESRVLP